MGPWMKDIRDDIFLATKTGMRTYDEAKAGVRYPDEKIRVSPYDKDGNPLQELRRD